MYDLHPRLQKDTVAVSQLTLCELRLLNDRRFPWLVLIPQKNGITEVHQLETEQQYQLIAESSRVAHVLEQTYCPAKINIGALGNLVPQLHWHVIARFHNDTAWPDPVWGSGPPEPYDSRLLAATIKQLQKQLN